MPEHYSKNTEAVSHFCKTCNRLTMHTVCSGRLGPCMESHVKEKPPVEKPEERQLDLFNFQN